MPRGYQLTQFGSEVQAALDKIIALGPASATVDGIMTKEDKAKLDAIGIHYNTTEYWNAQVGYVPEPGELVIYADHKVVDGIAYPGIKVGSGNGFVQDLAFVGQEEADILLAHISNAAAHTTAAEKMFWNRKLNVDDAQEVFGETLVFNRN